MSINIIIATMTGLLLGLAWIFTGQALGAVLGWLFVAWLLVGLTSQRPLFTSYLAGVIALLIGFYWLPHTINVFGGFSAFPAYFLLLLFATISAIQFLIFAAIFKLSQPFLSRFAMTAAVSWLAAELLWIRIFPWEPAHTQLPWTSFVQMASIGGASLVTFVMFFICEATYRFIWLRQASKAFIFALIVLLSGIMYGKHTIAWYEKLAVPEQNIALIQANISTEEKHNITLFKKNTERYIELTQDLYTQGHRDTIVLWPESVILDWIDDDLRLADDSLPAVPDSFALLSGALTYNNKAQNFNSAIAIFSDKQMPAPYHKRILMPFGEYMPGSTWLPWIQDLNPLAQGFTAGDTTSIFKFQMAEHVANLAPLICYEDIVPKLSRAAVQKGAHVLVNLTNDAWFGNTKAPLQHNTIASFRAIENQRYLLRATNSGLTAVVNPLGQAEKTLTVFSDGQITQKIKLLNHSTWYSSIFGDSLRLLCLFLIVSLIIGRRFYRKPY